MHQKDISQAFLFHLQWKIRLRDFIDGKNGFDIAELPPEGCSLGKWLGSAEMREHLTASEAQELVSAHNELHETARRIYDAKTAGNDNAARQELGTLAKSSLKIHSLLRSLRLVPDSHSPASDSDL